MSAKPAACPTGVRPCGEPTRADVFNGVWCACERGVSGIDARAAGEPT